MDKQQLIQNLIDQAQTQIDQLQAQHYQLTIQIQALYAARDCLVNSKQFLEARAADTLDPDYDDPNAVEATPHNYHEISPDPPF